MRLRTLIVVVMIALFAAFVALNWATFFATTSLNLMLATVEAPLGIVMLGLIMLLVLSFLAYMALWQGSVLKESRRHAKELHQQRALAEQAEASRFNDLRAALHDEVAALTARISLAQEQARTELRDSTNSLAAMIGELDARLQTPAGAAPRHDPTER